MTKITKHIVLVGCGKMGSSLVEGWLKNGILASNITIIEPNLANENLLRDNKIASYADYKEIALKLPKHIVVFAVKPQSLKEVLNDYKNDNIEAYITIAAGKKLAFYEEILDSKISLIRAMPNLPATISLGVTGLFANKNCAPDIIKQAEILFSAVGSFVWLKKEDDIDSLTAISGSGPAYLFYFMEKMILAAKKIGFSDELANKLVLDTIYGSASLAKDNDVAALRKAVTSPGGTTEAALKIFSQDDLFEKIILEAIEAAKKKSQVL